MRKCIVLDQFKIVELRYYIKSSIICEYILKCSFTLKPIRTKDHGLNI